MRYGLSGERAARISASAIARYNVFRYGAVKEKMRRNNPKSNIFFAVFMIIP
jgi:hypothetical protein